MTYVIDWDQTSALARDRLFPRVVDQFFKSNAMMYRLRPKAETATGRSLVQPVSFAPEGGGGQWWGGVDRFQIVSRNPITAAQYFWKNFELPIVITDDEELLVTGPEALMSLLEAKMKIARRSVMGTLGGSTGIYNAGTNPKAMTGLQYSLKAGAAGGNLPPTMTYGGISCSSTLNTWWNHQSINTVQFTTGPGSNTYVQGTTFGVWDKMFAAQKLASGKSCSLILCNWGVWNDVSALVNSKTTWFRPQQNDALHKAGFTTFNYVDKSIVVDEEVPRDSSTKVEQVMFIDEEALHLWIHPQRNFMMTDWMKPIDQALRVAHIFVRLEMGFDERRSSGIHPRVDTTLTSP